MHQDQTDFLNSRSLKFIEMALGRDRIERLADPDGYGKRTGECGDAAEQEICFLETLPEDHFHCSELAVGAFYLALTDIKCNKPEKSNI